MYVTFICLFVFQIAFSQQYKSWLPPTVSFTYLNNSYQKAISDTLDSHFDSATVALYPSPNGGYVSGNSGYGEAVKLQEFVALPDSAYKIEGVLFWFGYKNISSTLPGNLKLRLYDFDSIAQINNVSTPIPKSILLEHSVALTSIDTGANFPQDAYIWLFSSITVKRNFGAAIAFDALGVKDTIALYSSTDGDPPVSGNSWELWQGSWATILSNWNLDIDFAIFPLADKSNIAVESLSNGLFSSFTLQPNPVKNYIQLRWKGGGDFKFKATVFSVNGKRISTKLLKASAKMARFNCSNLPGGVYILAIETPKGNFGLKFIKRH